MFIKFVSFVIIRNQVKFSSPLVFPSYTFLLTDSGVLSRQNYHGAWGRTRFFILLIFVSGSCSCNSEFLFIGSFLGLWLHARHVWRGVDRDLLLGPNAFGASHLTQTKAQQDDQGKNRNKGIKRFHFHPYLQIYLQLYLYGYNVNSTCVMPGVSEHDSSQISPCEYLL